MNRRIIEKDLEHILAHTQGLWGAFQGKRLFLTGGTGFFGKWFLESFIWANRHLHLEAQLVVLTRNSTLFLQDFPQFGVDPSVSFHQGDIQSFDFPTETFDFVIHAATAASVQMVQEAPLEMFDTIVAGTRHTLDFAVHCGAKRFLLTSSGAVYGSQPSELVNVPESYQGAPSTLLSGSVYGEAKRLAELLCVIYQQQHGLHCSIARCFAFVGPYLNLDIHYAVGNFIRDGLKQQPIHIRGDGTPTRSYLYAADLMIWLWTILVRGQRSQAYNVGSDQSVSIKELALKVRGLLDPSPEVIVEQKASLEAPLLRYVPSTELARTELQLETFIPLNEALSRTIKFYQSN